MLVLGVAVGGVAGVKVVGEGAVQQVLAPSGRVAVRQKVREAVGVGCGLDWRTGDAMPTAASISDSHQWASRPFCS